MEDAKPPAPPKGVKHERSPSPEPAESSPPIKRQTLEAPEPEDEPAEDETTEDELDEVVDEVADFSWAVCEDLEDAQRLQVKQKAVELAEEYCAKIHEILESVLAKGPTGENDPEAVVMGLRNFREWLLEHDRVRDNHRNRGVLVGVEGPTGAGKSSFLGSLLRIQELLPSSQESAATAVVGKVSWNWDDTPGQEFRAKIIFRKKDEIEADLKLLLQEMKYFVDMVESGEYDDDEDEDRRLQGIEIARAQIDHELPKIKAVWRLGEKDLMKAVSRCTSPELYDQAVQWILGHNERALQLMVEGVKQIGRSSAKELSRAVKPYLDSTTGKHGGKRSFSAWPLVEMVHIYVKADILKSGITLVDLPGCGDAIASRAEVAKKFSRELDVRMVVSPICRAVDEKQGHALMRSGFEEVQMKINGKLNERGFCVVLSKMDDISVDTYINGCPELVEDEEVMTKQEELETLKDEKKSLKVASKDLRRKVRSTQKEAKKARKAYETAIDKHFDKAQDEPVANNQAIMALRETKQKKQLASKEAVDAMRQHDLQDAAILQKTKRLKAWLHHRAIQTRNRRVKERLDREFRIRQALLSDPEGASQAEVQEESWLPILPISTRAFWQLENGEATPDGFPTKRFTGIPAAEQWLHGATLEKCERRLDDALARYLDLMAMMRTYSQETDEDVQVNFTRAQVEMVLGRTHADYFAKLCARLAKSAIPVQHLNPISNPERTTKKFNKTAVRVASKWSMKFPNERSKTEKMHYATHQAILVRNGGRYTTGSYPKVTYTWIETIATPMLRNMANEWDNKMNKQRPQLKEPIVAAFSKTWAEYLQQLDEDIRKEVPALQDSFTRIRPALENSQRTSEGKICAVIDELAQKAANVSFDAVEILTETLCPTFQGALAIVGRGAYAKREAYIVNRVGTEVEPMGKDLMDRLEKGLAARKREVPGQMNKLAAAAIEGVKQQVSLLMNNLVENDPRGSIIQCNKGELQKKIRAVIEDWGGDWRLEVPFSDHILNEDVSIPEALDDSLLEGEDDDVEILGWLDDME